MKLEDIKNNTDRVRDSLLFIELAALLHDIGKLSKDFLEYRKKWQDEDNGYELDPHAACYEAPSVFMDLFNNPNTDIEKEFGSKEFSVIGVIREHEDPPENDIALKFIKAADSIDSAQDRNNPLFGGEQKEEIFRSNVFGFETRRNVDIAKQDTYRRRLYSKMADPLKDYLRSFKSGDRIKLLEIIKEAFEQGLSDTTRPQNDTTLWEHCYSVASITKAISAHYLLSDKKEPMDNFAKVKFGILGVGWDGVSFISSGEKIGDILGRKKLIDNVKICLKELIEYDYCLGNTVYEDDDGIYFLIPPNLPSDDIDTLKAGISYQVLEITGNELQPHIHYSKETKSLTHIVKTTGHVKAAAAFRFEGAIGNITFDEGKTLCPICRLRPAKNKDIKICDVCNGRRTGIDLCNEETPFIDEIVDKNGRAALIVARFGLDEWLSGRMVRTLFVTEADGIKKEIGNLVTVEQFKALEKDYKEFFKQHDYGKFDYKRIKGDIDSLFNGTDDRATKIQFLYSRRVVWDRNKEWRLAVDNASVRRNWQEALGQAAKETPGINIYNVLCAKTPTPSTVLDVWETTREFLKMLPDVVIKHRLEKRERVRLKIKPAQYLPGAIAAETAGKRIDLIFNEGDNEHVEIIGGSPAGIDWHDQLIKVTEKKHPGQVITEGSEYLPFRTIIASPNLFMAIVPADKAVEITREIYKRYAVQFGKVMGRLPFSIGNIFFKEKMPMFIVLDAARRMLANFDKLSETALEFMVKQNLDVSGHSRITFNAPGRVPLTWALPYRSGNGKDDYHHPYFIVPEGEWLANTRSTYFETPAGAVVHFSQVQSGDALRIYPNYYDFEFLDSNVRRHDIHLDRNNTRQSRVADFKSRPYLLEELDQHISFLWDALLKGKGLDNITDAKLRNLQSLWLTKYQEWVEPDRANLNLWKEFITGSIAKEFSDSECKEFLTKMVESGLFFDTLELYMGILKRRIEGKEE